MTACGSNTNDKTSKYGFEKTDIQGETIGLSEEKPTLIYFMAAWCPTCVGGEKVFAELHKQYGDKVQLITVDIDPSVDTKEQLKKFQQKYGGNWPHVIDENQEMAKKFQVKQLEEVSLINLKGEQVFRGVNPSLEELQEALANEGVTR
ncbi:TlpA family protein disulfide reductase [Filobacillus milosensis]|uniref:TlpA family protein disulfide reductase n=2 Tax=Filobacillus milosensis TaxID=94137 RepID=A0A4Y8IKG7_9BACI|nr:TlpA family protein disulfide reductase [Filobacillus milosensis]